MVLVMVRDWLNGGAVRYGGEFAGEGCLRCIAMRPHRSPRERLCRRAPYHSLPHHSKDKEALHDYRVQGHAP